MHALKKTADTRPESPASMTPPRTGTQSPDKEHSADELEALMSVIRDTGLAATSAAATTIVMQDVEGGQDGIFLSGGSNGPIDTALYEFCMSSDKTSVLGYRHTAPAIDIDRPYRARSLTLRGATFVLLALPFAGHRPSANGIMGFALDASGDRLQELSRICAQIVRCAEMVWFTYDGMSGLAGEVIALSDRASQLQRIAEIDPLTQLENSASFESKVRAALVQNVSHAAFIMVDIDHFKQINDLYGHQFGDLYLKTIARSLRSSFPEGSIVGRLGGDEFGILTPIPSSGRTYLESLLSRSRSAIQRATALQGKPDLGKVSIGASQYPDHGKTYATLFDHADAALYAAKESGRSLSAVYHPNRHQSYNSAELARRFRVAVAKGDICPHFQPVVNVEDGSCAGFEVLARWRDDNGNYREPSEFSAIFRDHSMAEKMTRTIMHAAFRDYARAIAPTGLPLRVALNVTFFDLMNPEFAFEVQHAVAETGFDWNLLTIEVTEQTMLGESTGQIFRSLKELRTRGAQIALDDFGTGYGGLRHISHWPVDILKIDKFFVDGLNGSERDRAVFESVTGLARRLGYTVIAEGIETADQIAVLREHGCGFAQGFAFDRPMTGDDLANFRRSYPLP